MSAMSPNTDLGISVIIPLYNKQATIGRAIRSILAQTDAPREVVVVDDGSTDQSAQAVQAFGADVLYVKQENAGPAAARNRGVAASRYPLVVFLDADDELAPGALRDHIRCREHFPDVQASFGSFRVLQGDTVEREEIIYRRLPETRAVAGCHYVDRFLSRLVPAQQSCCIDRDFYDAIGGYDARLRCWERSDFHLRVLLRAKAVAVSEQLHLVKHQDVPENSQFERAVKNWSYMVLFAHNILDQLQDIPVEERPFLFNQVRQALQQAWSARALEDFKQLAARACTLLPLRQKPLRLCLAAKLPEAVLARLPF